MAVDARSKFDVIDECRPLATTYDMRTFWELVEQSSLSETYSNELYDDLITGTFGTGHSLNLPAVTMHLEPKRIRAKVMEIRYNETPIKVRLSDGTVWTLTPKQWNIIKSQGQVPHEGSVVEAEIMPNGSISGLRVERQSPGTQKQSAAGTPVPPSKPAGMSPPLPV